MPRRVRSGNTLPISALHTVRDKTLYALHGRARRSLRRLHAGGGDRLNALRHNALNARGQARTRADGGNKALHPCRSGHAAGNDTRRRSLYPGQAGTCVFRCR
ncbi:hypothetical protein LJC59_04040, partial [Desulfovibrio sp. OttesenSCG-928-A18]|nr:hypothetical protein [Desulfovibrio sp. OttesenSCG-928-A18]